MSFTFTMTRKEPFGNKTRAFGTFTNSTGDDTGGDIVTGLNRVEWFGITVTGSAVATNESVVNETITAGTIPASVTIVTDANVDGTWEAIGT